ncbi:MAG: hypothetical protein FJ005_07775 [Chloroflexi bacterium]|nr:hypothetical protein [Chloroflexota bacterium]
MLHKCGFCQGTGEVRRSSISGFIVCQVCSGEGIVSVEEPVAVCTFCKGTGKDLYKYPQALITHSVCRGKGVLTQAKSNIELSCSEEEGDTPKGKFDISLFKYPMSRSGNKEG